MNHVAHFKDGPLHDTHMQLPRPMDVFLVPRPQAPPTLMARDLDPSAVITLQTGRYERATEPQRLTDTMYVWRYAWKGWQ